MQATNTKAINVIIKAMTFTFSLQFLGSKFSNNDTNNLEVKNKKKNDVANIKLTIIQ